MHAAPSDAGQRLRWHPKTFRMFVDGFGWQQRRVESRGKLFFAKVLATVPGRGWGVGDACVQGLGESERRLAKKLGRKWLARRR